MPPALRMLPTPPALRALLALVGCLLVCGCYLGSARSATPADLGADEGWERIEGVPEVRQVARQDCGAAALAMVLGYWGRTVTRDEISAANPPAPERGISAGTLRDFARRQGLQAFVIPGQRGDLERELQQHHPVLVGVVKRYGRRAYPHYEVVVGMSRRTQRILTLDPADGLRVDSGEGFAAEWAAAKQVTLIIYPYPASTITLISPPIKKISPVR
jgi:ABC-type bacteriocin/lantibiotic exporter with double-glycine peptidase domain